MTLRMTIPPTSPAHPTDDSLIVYPCVFPIKVMGAHVHGFAAAMMDVAGSYDPAFDRSTVELRESKGGKFLGVTLMVRATSRAQLDDIYRALTSHPMVKIVL